MKKILEEVDPLPSNSFSCENDDCRRAWIIVPVSENKLMFMTRLRDGESLPGTVVVEKVAYRVMRVPPRTPRCPICGNDLIAALSTYMS